MKKSIIEGLFYDSNGRIYFYKDKYILKKQYLIHKQLWIRYKDKRICVPTLILNSEGAPKTGRFINHIDGNIYNNSVGNIEFIDKKNICIIEGCESFCVGMGYCCKHYTRNRLGKNVHKNTNADKRVSILEGDIIKVPLGLNAKGGYAIIDKEYSNICDMKWIRSSNGYPTLTGVKPVYMHHMIIGYPPTGFVVDHIDRNKLNNCSKNLRITTHKINANNKDQNKGKRYLVDGESFTAKEYSENNNISLSKAYRVFNTNAYLPGKQ